MTALTAWPAQAQDWLDERGKPAWIAAMILGFIVFWPLGLALLFYMIWSRRMCNASYSAEWRQHRDEWRRQRRMHREMHRHGFRSSGNTAFDAYKAETLRRLEDEQDAFEAFLQRLRDAKDKTEFDTFMDERAKTASETPPEAPEAPQAPQGPSA
jgi:hypothetical protein